MPFVVVSASQEACRYARQVDAPTDMATGVLASSVTRRTKCGTADHPWYIEALPGQRINITMTDFRYRDGSASAEVRCFGSETFRFFQSSEQLYIHQSYNYLYSSFCTLLHIFLIYLNSFICELCAI